MLENQFKPVPDASELQVNRVYKCGCICKFPAAAAVENDICPMCLVKQTDARLASEASSSS